MGYELVIRDTHTGQARIFKRDDDLTPAMVEEWRVGGKSCDCCRHREWHLDDYYEADPDSFPINGQLFDHVKECLGASRFQVLSLSDGTQTIKDDLNGAKVCFDFSPAMTELMDRIDAMPEEGDDPIERHDIDGPDETGTDDDGEAD
jgi:hypothetical protein